MLIASIAPLLVILLVNIVTGEKQQVQQPPFLQVPLSFQQGQLLSPTNTQKADTTSCRVIYFQQPLDHFSFAVNTQTYKQRVFICDPNDIEGRVRQGVSTADDTNVFFYTGNEADVELYVNNTGLMWENAANFNAILIFAEHRYFGKSRPFPGEPMPKGNDKMKYLNTDQALADYASLIFALKTQNSQINNNNINKTISPPLSVAISAKSPVTGFGGSYGGMLCSWMRLKYPSALNAGCIAGSAPIIDFENMTPALNFDFYNKIVTDDCGVKGGLSTNNCQWNIHNVMKRLASTTNTQADYDVFTEALGLCNPIKSYNDAMTAVNSFIGSIGTMAMGSYPYASDYMLNGNGVLPPYPLRYACSNTGLSRDPQYFVGKERELLQAFAKGVNIFYNAGSNSDYNNINKTNNKQACINVQQSVNEETAIVNYLWGYLSCTTLVMPQSANGNLLNGGDMFISQPWDMQQVINGCVNNYNVFPNPWWVQASYGGRGVPHQASKIFFSNGELDPWRGGGITPGYNNNNNNNKYIIKNYNNNPSIHVAIVRGGGHHMDLMFSNPQDKLTNVAEVRQAELDAIVGWINEARQQS